MHSVKISDGYGDDNLFICLDDKKIQNVKSYAVKGETGKVPELTITLDVISVLFDGEKENASKKSISNTEKRR